MLSTEDNIFTVIFNRLSIDMLSTEDKGWMLIYSWFWDGGVMLSSLTRQLELNETWRIMKTFQLKFNKIYIYIPKYFCGFYRHWFMFNMAAVLP